MTPGYCRGLLPLALWLEKLKCPGDALNRLGAQHRHLSLKSRMQPDYCPGSFDSVRSGGHNVLVAQAGRLGVHGPNGGGRLVGCQGRV